jgi:hypothetical protein
MTLGPVDTEAVLTSALGANVGTKVPRTRPAFFTRVVRSGGTQQNLRLSTSRLTVECWAPTEVGAFSRAAEAWRACRALEGATTGGVYVAEVELTDPVNFPDDDGSPRYQFVAQLTYALKEPA